MSENLDREKKFIGLVLSTAATDDSPLNCAFHRAWRAVGSPPGSWFDLGKLLGYSPGETAGIIRGWDMAAGFQFLLDPNWVRDIEGLQVADDDIRRGEEIGKRVHAACWAGAK